MSAQFKAPPLWLLHQVGLADGAFDETGTIIVGRYDAHNSAVLNIGHGPPAAARVDLTKRADWAELKKRLADENL